MTVQQLINQLQQLDPKAEVVLSDSQQRFQETIETAYAIQPMVEELKENNPQAKAELEEAEQNSPWDFTAGEYGKPSFQIPNKVVLEKAKHEDHWLDSCSAYVIRKALGKE